MLPLNLQEDEHGDYEFEFNQRHGGSWYGKPLFPQYVESYDISDYIGPDIIVFFKTMGPLFLGGQCKDVFTLPRSCQEGGEISNPVASRGEWLQGSP